jgi:hypothetical protein
VRWVTNPRWGRATCALLIGLPVATRVLEGTHVLSVTHLPTRATLAQGPNRAGPAGGPTPNRWLGQPGAGGHPAARPPTPVPPPLIRLNKLPCDGLTGPELRLSAAPSSHLTNPESQLGAGGSSVAPGTDPPHGH